MPRESLCHVRKLHPFTRHLWLRWLLLAAVVVMLFPAAASAATVTSVNDSALYQGEDRVDRGDAVKLTISHVSQPPRWEFEVVQGVLVGPDPRPVQLTPGTGCENGGDGGFPGPASCTLTSTATVNLAGGDDYADVTADRLVTVSGGTGSDQLSSHGSGPVVLDGGPGSDTLRGGDGDDRLLARDGEPDMLDCGAGADTAVVDPVDTVRGCETVLYADDDNDGADVLHDCNDHNASI